MTHLSNPNFFIFLNDTTFPCFNTMMLTRLTGRTVSFTQQDTCGTGSVRSKISRKGFDQECTPRKSLWFSFNSSDIVLYLVRSSKYCINTGHSYYRIRWNIVKDESEQRLHWKIGFYTTYWSFWGNSPKRFLSRRLTSLFWLICKNVVIVCLWCLIYLLSRQGFTIYLGCIGILYINQVDLELTEICLIPPLQCMN